ncbi:MAG: cobyric acid synthase, partial [Myxococcota bacterium]
TGERGAQVVVGGHPVGHLSARDYRARRAEWWEAVTGAWARLSAEADVVVLEGAGSPAEVNLRAGDLVNMAMAHHADARVLLVGDIDRGGVFASLYGTLAWLDAADRARVAGLVVNRFRGDPEILRPGLAPLEERCGVPVVGVVPMRADIPVDEEDSLDLPASTGLVDICVLRFPTVSTFTYLGPLARMLGVGLRGAARPEEVGNPDLLVLPGAKDTLGDVRWLHARGLDRSVHAAAARGIPVLGLCGGYQALGRVVRDGGDAVEGLGLLPVETTMAPDKTVRPITTRTRGGWLLPAGLPCEGYEIHHGVTAAADPLLDGDGAVRGLVAGTYLHGLFERAEVAEALVARLRERKGLPAATPARRLARTAAYDALADHLEAHLDLARALGPLPGRHA